MVTVRTAVNRRAMPVLLVLVAAISSPAFPQSIPKHAPSGQEPAVIWSDPGDIKSRDLFNGSGGKSHYPQLPVRFLKEDRHGHNSKLDVEDSLGTKWKAKLGIESQPETVATRLLWAVGYFTNVDYFVANLEVKDLPAHLRRGGGHVISANHLDKVRLQHSAGAKQDATWGWRHNPFVGRREFNGLRIMMALISNWDLKNENNAILVNHHGRVEYMVTDVGTAFGASGNRFTEAQSKNTLKAYRRSTFITKVTPTYVNFNFPRFPPILYIFDLPQYIHQVSLRWVGNRVPREDAKWLGGLLGQLTSAQIEDAFRAGGYPADQAGAFTAAVEARIAELNRL